MEHTQEFSINPVSFLLITKYLKAKEEDLISHFKKSHTIPEDLEDDIRKSIDTLYCISVKSMEDLRNECKEL